MTTHHPVKHKKKTSERNFSHKRKELRSTKKRQKNEEKIKNRNELSAAAEGVRICVCAQLFLPEPACSQSRVKKLQQLHSIVAPDKGNILLHSFLYVLHVFATLQRVVFDANADLPHRTHSDGVRMPQTKKELLRDIFNLLSLPLSLISSFSAKTRALAGSRLSVVAFEICLCECDVLFYF